MLRPPARAGASSSRSIRPSRKRESRAGASRKSSADRDGGVSTTIRSHSSAGAQLAQLLHRHVLLRAGEGRAHRLVERVGEDLRGPLRVGVREHDLVEGPLHVEHHGVQLAAAGLGVDALDLARGVVQLGQAQRLGQPAGRVDGQHDGAPAVLLGGPQRRARPRWWSCRRRRSRSRPRSGSPGSARSASTSSCGARRSEAPIERIRPRRSRAVLSRCESVGAAGARPASSRPGPVDARRAAAAARSSAGPARPARRAATPRARAGSGAPCASASRPATVARSAGSPAAASPRLQLGLGDPAAGRAAAAGRR